MKNGAKAAGCCSESALAALLLFHGQKFLTRFKNVCYNGATATDREAGGDKLEMPKEELGAMEEREYQISIQLNGTTREFTVGEQETLLHVLRERAIRRS